MRIDTLSKVSQLYNTNSTKKAAMVNSTSSVDKVEISQMGRDYQVAKQAVKAADDIREDKIAALKKSMADGTYNVSDSDFADKLLANYLA